MCSNCEPIDPDRIHIVDVLDSDDGRLRAVISTTEGAGAHPIALHDQIEAQTSAHLRAMTRWYMECLTEHPEADDLERYVNLVSHLAYVFPSNYLSNMLARAVQERGEIATMMEELKDDADELGKRVKRLIAALKEARSDRDALRELVIGYQAAAQADDA